MIQIYPKLIHQLTILTKKNYKNKNFNANIIYDILKQYKVENYKDDYYKNVDEKSYKYKILSKEIKIKTIFVESINNNKAKYLMNPPNWGPKGRAKEIK